MYARIETNEKTCFLHMNKCFRYIINIKHNPFFVVVQLGLCRNEDRFSRDEAQIELEQHIQD